MKKGRKLLSTFMALILVLGLLPISAFAADGNVKPVFSDMPDNWSTKALENAVANGLLNGSDGKIMPNDNLTRAQMAAIITRAFGADVNGDISRFKDVKSTNWYYDSMAKAYQMGVIKGSDGMLNPNDPITRQEVFVIIARAFKLQPDKTINKEFTDINEVSDWAKGEVYAVVNKGYVQGSDGKLNPKGNITRAEFAQVFDNILTEYIQTEGEYTSVADGNVIINTPNVTLKDLTVEGDLIIADGVGDGEVILDNVDIKGRLVVRGGGINSIIIRGNSSVSNIIVARVDGNVSIKVQGDANVEVIYIDDGSNDVNIEGTIGNLDVNAPGILVTTTNAQIDTINVLSEASRIVVDSKSKVGTLNVKENAEDAKIEIQGKVTTITTEAPNTGITGTGTVEKVQVKEGATDVSIETPNTQIEVDKGVTGVTGFDGVEIEGGSSVSNGDAGTTTTTPVNPPAGGGGGGGIAPSPTVSAITIATNPTYITGLYNDVAVEVTLTTSTQGADIYYTTDGSTPSASSTKYTEPFMVVAPGVEGGTVTVKAVGAKSGYTNSAVAMKSIVFAGEASPNEEKPVAFHIATEEFNTSRISFVLFEIYRLGPESEPEPKDISNLDAADFTLLNTSTNSAFDGIRFVDDPEDGYSILPPESENFASGSYKLIFEKAGYRVEELTLTITEVGIVNTSWLNQAIIDAEDNLASVEISTDGSDVASDAFWITEDVKNTYNIAITTAKEIAIKVDATQQEVDDAVTDLDTATLIFDEAKQAGTKVSVVTINQINTASVEMRKGSIIMGFTFEDSEGVISYELAKSNVFALDDEASTVTLLKNDSQLGNIVKLSELTFIDSDEGESGKVIFEDFEALLTKFGLNSVDPANIPTHVKVVVKSKTTVDGKAVENPWGPIEVSVPVSSDLYLDSGIDSSNSSATIESGNKTAGQLFPVAISLKDAVGANLPNGNYMVEILNGDIPVGGGETAFSDGQASVNTLLTMPGTYNLTVKVNNTILGNINVEVVSSPVLDSLATTMDGKEIHLTFGKTMADPNGKHNQFTVTVNGQGNPVTQATLKVEDNKTVVLTLANTLTSGETITIAYTQGDVVAEDNGILCTFMPYEVINNVAETYTITYFGNGAENGSVPVDNNSYMLNSYATILGNTGNLAKDGYTFGGWNTSGDGNGGQYIPGDTIPMYDNVTLYAVWNTGAKELLGTTIGQLVGNPATGVENVPAGTKVSELITALTVSDKARVDILVESGGAAVGDPSTREVAVGMVILVTADDGTTAEYGIELATVQPAAPNGDLLDAVAGSTFTMVLYTRDGSIYYNQVDTEGTWGTEALISTGGTEGRLAIDSTDKAHVVYTVAGKIGYRVYDGSNWAEEVLIESNNGGSCSKPDIAVDGSGKAHITYTDTRGNVGDYTDHPDIMYATNISGSFTKTLIYNGHYESYGGADAGADYYNKGSFIAVDNDRNYYILTHHYNFYKWMSGNDKNYYAKIKTPTKEIVLGSNYASDIINVFDIIIRDGKIYALYQHSNVKSAELIIDGANLTINRVVEATEITTAYSHDAEAGNIVIGSMDGNYLRIHYNGTAETLNTIEVKGYAVSIVNLNGSFYAVYTDNSDGKIKLTLVSGL